MNPIEKAVEPLKSASMEAARESASQYLAKLKDKLEAAGWDLQVAAPYPTGKESREWYLQKKTLRNNLQYLTSKDPANARYSIRLTDPVMVVWDDEAEQRFINNRMKDAASEFEAYVYKLKTKVGEVVSAEMTYVSGLWYNSILTVTKEDKIVERWKTSCIVNCSVLGKLFNQWPTRKMK